ncbi:Hypothetical_protein [Hexamita inflata]|uniref:Hypothetical_protein n=1 Tax=Hexamita inflata TaxID=28002 RepID=A0AA86P065_9EUKA|nr:Hypothetical protein HINF_LOCUS16918 [Hexamita inflata]
MAFRSCSWVVLVLQQTRFEVRQKFQSVLKNGCSNSISSTSWRVMIFRMSSRYWTRWSFSLITRAQRICCRACSNNPAWALTSAHQYKKHQSSQSVDCFESNYSLDLFLFKNSNAAQKLEIQMKYCTI